MFFCDRPQPGRSDYPQVNHNYLGFPDGVAARELRAWGTAQAERYGAQVCRSERVAIRRTPDGFAREGSGGEDRGAYLTEGEAACELYDETLAPFQEEAVIARHFDLLGLDPTQA